MLIQKRIPEQNVARFYRIGLQSDLFGGWTVLREWGRIGRAGRLKAEAHANAAGAEAAAQAVTARKLRRGYG